MSPIVFLDTETTGLSLDDDVWEFAAIRREDDGRETAHGFEPGWHYHLIDVENLAVGYLAGRGDNPAPDAIGRHVSLPWDSNALSLAVGVDPDRFARHTAMGDVLWAKAIYDTVMDTERGGVA